MIAKFADLNLPEAEETEKIGDVPVSDLTPEEKEFIQQTGNRDQLVEDAKHPNLKQHPIRFLSDDREGKLIPLPIEELVNRSFLLPIEKDGTRRRAVIKEVDSKAYKDYMNHIQSHPDCVKFCIKVGGEEFDKLVEYNKVLNFVEEEFYNGEGNAWHCHRILGHKHVNEDDPEYDNCPYNILVEWTDGQRSCWEPANIFRGDTLEWMVGKYAYDNDLLRDKYGPARIGVTRRRHESNPV